MNDYQKNRGHPCDSEEWFFKILGAPEYESIWAPNRKEDTMSKAPETCLYCDGEGNSSAGGPCGFCELASCYKCEGYEGVPTNKNDRPCSLCDGKGWIRKPLDTQEDWDQSWGKTHAFLARMRDEITLSEKDQDKVAELLRKNEFLKKQREI